MPGRYATASFQVSGEGHRLWCRAQKKNGVCHQAKVKDRIGYERLSDAVNSNKGSTMKNCLFRFLCIVLLGLSLCAGHAQSPAPDVLYFKNGSIIKGTILELIPDKTVKIETADGSILVYAMAEVEKITKEPNPVLTDSALTSQLQVGESPEPGGTVGGSGVALFGGVSLPVGDFGSTLGPEAGAAKTGYAVGADASLALTPVVAWMSSVSFSVNGLDIASALEGFGISVDAGSWTSVWALSGLRVFGNVSPDVEVFAFGQAGLLFGTSPRITLTVGNEHATQNSASATGFAFGIGAGITIGHVSFGVRYLSGQPEYAITASGPNGTVSGNFKQPTSCVLITGGFVF